MKRPRLLLADDHTLLLEGFKKLLESEFELAGAVADGRALLEAAPALRPDVILLDISMPLLNGIDAARQLRKIVPESKLVFVTMHADRDYVTEAFRAGGSAYILKRSAASELVRAIQEVLKGRTYITPLIVQDAASPIPGRTPRSGKPSGGLSPRQREVLQLVAEGRSAKEIASILRISVKTVEFHKARIMQALGIHSVAELTRYAVAHGLVGP